jgi:hypothetical protein
MTFEQWWAIETKGLNPTTTPYYEHFRDMARAAWLAGDSAGYHAGWEDCERYYTGALNA